MSTRYSIGVDIGGTFTDVVLISESGQVRIAKGLSTPGAFDRGIADILQELLLRENINSTDCELFVHGTTVATNAIIERKGARTGLITTKGFRDVLELRRIRIPKLYDLTWQKPKPLVERYLRLEVTERMTHRGEVNTPLDEQSVVRAVAELQRLGAESVAVCLLNSYANPAHERAVCEIIRRLAPNMEVTISSEVLAEMREYERTSTSVINAYLMPVVRRYVASLERTLCTQGFKAPLLLMQSNGGAMTAELGCEQPMHIIESGPAAGVVASYKLARRIGIDNAVTLDIGGTTAKTSLIEQGKLTYADEYDVGGGFSRGGQLQRGGGYVLRAPTLDISEIGAGGGSIVWIDSGGALQVGPKSAGASPGPVCYGHGGTEPTLTDACLVLGYLGSDGLAGGAVRLDR
ncbi:MAG: hydantoinase/oxoprolinase family protein, partial [Pseudolabrys sp.]